MMLTTQSSLERLAERAIAAHPTLQLTTTTFLSAVETHAQVVRARGDDVERWRDGLHVEDLYLATACVQGCGEALRALLDTHGELLLTVARRYAHEQAGAEDMRQALLQRLLVPSAEREARLGMYSGQGPLRAWLQVTATRAYLDMTRAAARRPELLVSGEHFDQMSDELRDLELDFLKQSYRASFKAAFAQAIERLSARQRNLLAQHTLARLNIDQLGAIYGVHRATAARWVEDARVTLAGHTRAALGELLELDEDEINSVMHLIQSQASLSLSRLLGGSEPALADAIGALPAPC
jgi:RNA polymerase sigma-70 factor, ECF subfamily